MGSELGSSDMKINDHDYRKVGIIAKSSYQIVIPKRMIQSLKLGKGDYVQLSLVEN